MCKNCWAGHGKPTIDTAVVRSAVQAIEAVYRWNAAGGNLHGILHDWNIDDEYFITDEPERIYRCDDPVDDANRHADELRCYRMLKAMLLEERAGALARFHGYID